MGPRSAVLTSLGAVFIVLLLSTFITGNLHYKQAAQHQDGSPVLYKSLSSSSGATLRGSQTLASDGAREQHERPEELASSVHRTSRTRRYLAFIPLLGLKVDDRGSQESERLTLKAWDSLATHVASFNGKEYDVDLRVVGMVEDAAHCDPQLFGASAHLLSSGAVSCVTLDPSCRHADFQGILTMDCILDTALELGEAWQADVYVLANGDVVFTPTLTEAITFAFDTFGDGSFSPSATTVPAQAVTAAAAAASISIQDRKAIETKDGTVLPTSSSSPSASSPSTPSSTASSASTSSFSSPFPGFAMVGRRMDLNVSLPDSPDDPPLTEDSLLHSDVEVRLHPATGIDYFAFTPNIFPRAFPSYLIGRWRWDNALLLHFLLSGAASIDASEVVHALHIGMGAYHSAEHVAREGGQYNDALAGNTTGAGHSLGRIDHTAYILKQRGLTEEEAEEAKRRQQRLSLRVERRSQPLGEGQLAALRVTGGSSFAGKSNNNEKEQQHQQQEQEGQGQEKKGAKADRTVLLLPVQAGEKDLALEWICWARRMDVTNYLLIVADQTEARSLESALWNTSTTASSSSSSSSSSVSEGGEVVYMDPGQLSVRGWGGSKAYFEQKKSGKASPAVLALGTGQLIRRLLRLELAVVLVPSLLSLWPEALSPSKLPPLSWWVLEEEGNDWREEEGAEEIKQGLMMALLYPSGRAGACDVSLWEERRQEEDTGNEKTELTHVASKQDNEAAVVKNHHNNDLPFRYARIEPTNKVRNGWDVVMACLKEDVRHSKSRQGWCLAGVSFSLCRQRAPVQQARVDRAAAVAPAHRWWDAANSQCLVGKTSRSRSSSSKDVTAIARELEN